MDEMGVIDPFFVAASYNRNMGLALDTDLALELECGTHRLALVLKCRVVR